MLDEMLKFSENQAITATAASTNVIDLGKDRAVSFGTPVSLLVRIKESFNTLTSLKIAVETCASSAFGSPTELASSTVLLANLTKGALIPMTFMPAGNKGYVRLKYTVSGSNPSTGKISAYLTDVIDESHHNKPSST